MSRPKLRSLWLCRSHVRPQGTGTRCKVFVLIALVQGVALTSHSLYSFFMLVVRRLVLLVLLVIPAFSATSHPLSSNLQDIAGQAEQAQASDHLPDAINLYQKGLHLDPRWKEGWWSLGSILYDQDRFPEAQAAFEHFVALSPNPGPGNAFLALCEYETHEYDRALHHFRSWASTGWTGTPQLIDVGVFHFALLLTREGSFVPALYLLSAEVQKN